MTHRQMQIRFFGSHWLQTTGHHGHAGTRKLCFNTLTACVSSRMWFTFQMRVGHKQLTRHTWQWYYWLCVWRRRVNTLLVESFPSQDLMPGCLVVVVVYFNDVIHVLLLNVFLLPPPPAETTRQIQTHLKIIDRHPVSFKSIHWLSLNHHCDIYSMVDGDQ